MFLRFSNHPDFARRHLSPVPQFIQPVSPQLRMPMVVMSSRYSISNNEHVLGYLQSMRIPVLGEATYGINGNITVFHLAGGATRNGLSGYFTGMQVNQHDGSALIGRGIQPDILVPVTAKGLRERRDVQLEAAQAYLEQRLARP
jgi:C-terminal processing protease CtpA/Prc